VPGDRRSVGTLVHAAMADARTIAPHIATRGEPVSGDTAVALLGSVSQAALHHSHCPVVIVPAGKPEEAP
jgi:nucleotide-binding universal stress UspA family protein